MKENSDNDGVDENDFDDVSAERLEEHYDTSGRSFGFFTRIHQSIVNKEFYRLVAIEPWSRALFYILKLVLLVSVVSAGLLLYQTYPTLSKIYTNLQRQIRPMTITNGQIEIEGNVPYEMSIIDDYKFVIDPEGELNRASLPPDSKIVAVLVDGGFYYRMGSEDFQFMSTRTTTDPDETSKLPSYTINADTLNDYRTTIVAVVIGANVLGVTILQFLLNIMRVGMISLGAWFLTRSQDTDRTYKTLLKMTCYLMTPIVAIDVLFSLTGLPMSSWGSTYEIVLLVLGSMALFHIQRSILPDRGTDSEADHTA